MQYPSIDHQPSTRTAFLIALLGGLLALVLRVYYVLHANVLQPVDQAHVSGDAVDYYRYAWNMVHHGVFSTSRPGSTDVIANSFRDPGYPAFLALWMLAFPDFTRWYGATLVTQAVLGAVTVSLLVLAARRSMPAWGLGVAAVAMAIWPHCIALPSFLLSENLFAPLCAAAALATVEAIHRRTLASWGIAGFVWSLAGMTNAVILPLAAVLGLILAWRRMETRSCLIAFVVASLVLPGAWGLRSALIPATTTSGSRIVMNFVQGSWPSYHSDYQRSAWGNPDATLALLEESNEMQAFGKSPLDGLQMIAARMSENPWSFVFWYLSKPALLWSWDIRIGQGDIYVYPTRNSPLKPGGALVPIEVACFILNPVIGVLALLGAGLACFETKRRAYPLVFAVAPLFATAVYTVLQSEPRYSIALRGFELLLATYFVVGASRWVRTKTVK
jgi:hypothetical protein